MLLGKHCFFKIQRQGAYKSLNGTKKNIKLATFAGFCYGVKRAVDLSVKIKKENPNIPVYILGQLIHNNQVTEYLENLGIKTIETIPENLQGICIIRTHGVPPQTIAELEKKDLKIIDATCPDVKRVQNKAKSLAQEGYTVIIIGKYDHPEVIGIKACADLSSDNETLVISSREEVEKYKDKIKKSEKVGIVVQTTQTVENFKSIVASIAELSKELKIFNTICSATFKRQQEAKELAKEVDLMIVAGSKSSANTTHLFEILSQINKTIHIETADNLSIYKEMLSQANTIGVTAGASTPDFVINQVIEKIGE